MPETAIIDLTLKPAYTAHELIGFEGNLGQVPTATGESRPYCDENYDNIHYPRAMVRIKGGRALYDTVSNRDGALDDLALVQLSRLEPYGRGLHVVARLVDEDTVLEVLMDRDREEATR